VAAPEQPCPSAIEAAIASLRASLRARYGWSHLALRVELEPGQRIVRVAGEVVSRRVTPALRAALSPELRAAWRLELDLRPLAVARWAQVPSEGLALWAEHPSAARRSLATELELDDGPIAELARDHDASLIRARDGTVGWTDAQLEPAAGPRPIAAPRPITPELGAEIYAHARTYLGVPYQLGAATRRHIDCSALVQRVLGATLGISIPRNTRDQLAAAHAGHARRQPSIPPARGDLLYIHSRRMQRLHVGILSGDGQILHASRTRDAVVEQPLDAFERDASWLRGVGWMHLREWARTQVGRAQLELPDPIELKP